MRRVSLLLLSSAMLISACSAAAAEEEPGLPTTIGLFDVTAPSPGVSATQTPTTAAPTTTSSTTTTTAFPQRERLVVTGGGDVSLDPTYVETLAIHGYRYPWTEIGPILENDDLTIVNLECAASDLGVALDKEFAFRCATEALPFMRAGGVEVANLGNNHSGDYGKEALVDSRAQLEAADLRPVGVGANAAEAHQPALFEIGGWTVAVLGFGGVLPSQDWVATADRPGMADGDTIETMAAAVEAADATADIVIVTIHWGVERDTTPRPDDQERAAAMVAAGADAVFGHHSHRLQPLEYLDGVPVAWGLGNLVWPTHAEEGNRSAVAQVVFEPDGSVDACLIPVFMEAPGLPVPQVAYDPDDPCGSDEG